MIKFLISISYLTDVRYLSFVKYLIQSIRVVGKR